MNKHSVTENYYGWEVLFDEFEFLANWKILIGKL